MPRPKTGWNTSSFPSFGTHVPAGNNSIIFPKPPNTGRLYWNIATRGQYGRNAGTRDEEYLGRIEQVIQTRIQSRQTPDSVKDILSKRPDMMPRNCNWGDVTKEAWYRKFPESTIHPDPAFQKTRDPKINKNLPKDQFSSDDFEWLRQRPLDENYENNRNQQSVALQGNIDNQWTEDDQERVQNQAHAARAGQQIQNEFAMDERLVNAYAEFDTYVNYFLEEGDKWQKPAGFTTQISKNKNMGEQGSFEKAMFLTRKNGPMMFYHPKWLQEQFRDKKGIFLFQLNSAELSEMHESLIKFLSMSRLLKNYVTIVQLLR